MTFPPGRARLATSPVRTGSPPLTITMGIVAVACMAARVAGVPNVTRMSTGRRTQLRRCLGEPVGVALGHSPLHGHVLAFDIAEVT